MQEPSNRVCSVPPALVMLDSSNSSLFTDLESLDFIPSRDNDTLHVFYVKQNQKTAHDILSNVVRIPLWFAETCSSIRPTLEPFQGQH